MSKTQWYRIIVQLVLTFTACVLFSQKKTIVVSGTIKDAGSGYPIESATVFIPQTKYFSESNVEGFYEFSVEFGQDIEVKVNRLGYESKSKIIKFSQLESVIEWNIFLNPLINPEIIISEKREDRGTDIREDLQSFELLPTVSGNIESVLPSIALGVRSSSGGELSSQYSVRGGSYDENLVFVNDFEIFRPQLIRNGQQ
ncbi:MAG: carboxypeptidase-like regulatory domain-containing protein, partial [Bacteroidota bacterium]|nr:carboxypeptidase-like regulatory domain-containing protein [Bacteroidota bacterium]